MNNIPMALILVNVHLTNAFIKSKVVWVNMT